MSISQLFTEEGPTLNLNFAGSRTLDPRITFTRTSTGTYMGSDGLIKVAPADAPRFDHRYVNGEIESLGLLVEESRVNYALRSEEFNLSPNSAINASISPNATIAPDGTLTADKLVEDNISSIYKRVQQGGFTVSGDYTVSFFVKEAGRYRGYIQLLNTTNASVSFNLQDGTASGIVPSRTKIEPYPNGWYRVSTSNTFNAGETPTVYIVMLSDSGQSTYTGDGSSGLYIWGLQVEPGAFPTSYIPTSGSTATRTADNASMTGSNFSSWYNPNEGTIFCSANSNPGVTTSTSRIFYAFRNSASPSGNFIRKWIWNGNTGLLLNSIYTSDGGPIAAEFSTSLETGNKKTAISYKQNDFARSYNGSVPLTDGGGNTPVGVNELQIGTNLSGHISQLTYYPVRLPNSTLQTLTK